MRTPWLIEWEITVLKRIICLKNFIFILSDQCYCGKSSDIASSTYGKATNCNMTCTGDQSSYCGGVYAMSVYQTYASGAA